MRGSNYGVKYFIPDVKGSDASSNLIAFVYYD